MWYLPTKIIIEEKERGRSGKFGVASKEIIRFSLLLIRSIDLRHVSHDDTGAPQTQ